ncbi:MAG: AMP-binding protein, partial [Magnetococcales bacterium]|nr:AMP-binding protein [Magnetococcales bacterium]
MAGSHDRSHPSPETLWQGLIEIARHLKSNRTILSDTLGFEVNYATLMTRAWILGRIIARETAPGERVGILLPTGVTAVTTYLAVLSHGRVPAMLNHTSGSRGLAQACHVAGLRRIYTAKKFIDKAKLDESLNRLPDTLVALDSKHEAPVITLLEELRDTITLWDKLSGIATAPWHRFGLNRNHTFGSGDDPATILFTSGSEGVPKGVVLSHRNILANLEQILDRLAFDSRTDIYFNILPMFHAFGLVVGTLAPLLTGIRTHLHPNPLEYKEVPRHLSRCKATLFAATDTFLKGYARVSSPDAWSTLRLVFAGAEPLRDDTRALWKARFGLDIVEGYGTTETSPVLAI